MAEKKSKAEKKNSLKPEIISIIIIGISILVIISVFSGNGKTNEFSQNAIGSLGGIICWLLKGAFGIGAYVLPFAAIIFCSSAFFSETKKIKISKFIIAVILFVILISFMHLVGESETKEAAECFKEGGAANGGFIGAVTGNLLKGIFGKIGTCIIFAVTAIILAVLITGKSFMDFSRNAYWKIKGLFEKDSVFDYEDEDEEFIEKQEKSKKKPSEKKNRKISKKWNEKKNKNNLQNRKQRTVKKDGKIISVNIPEKKDGREKVKISLFTDEIKKGRSNMPSFLSNSEENELSGELSDETINSPDNNLKSENKKNLDYEEKSSENARNLPENISDDDMFQENLLINGMSSNDYQAEYLKSLEIQEKIIEDLKQRYRNNKQTPYMVGNIEDYNKINEIDKDTDKNTEENLYKENLREEDLYKENLRKEDLEEDLYEESFSDSLKERLPEKNKGEDEKEYFDEENYEFYETEIKGITSDEYEDDENVKAAMCEYFGGDIGISVKYDRNLYFDEKEHKINDSEKTAAENNLNKNGKEIVPKEIGKNAPQEKLSERAQNNFTKETNNYKEKEPIILQAEKRILSEKNSAEENVLKKEYVFPPISFLEKNPVVQSQSSRDEILENSRILIKTLKSFNVDAKVNEICKGPTVTRYELTPGEGIKVSKILGLADNLAMSLAAKSIRIEAPIPGKSAVGIEIPNKEVMSVYLSEVICDKNFQNFKAKLAFGLGKDITGNVIVADIAKMPHMLIAGRTGAGKSVCINTLITSILYKSTPEEVKLIMVDPKVVELSVYNGIPHLLIPVVTDPQKAAGALNWAVSEMMARYDMFAKTGARNIKGYNSYCEENGLEKIPQIVIIIDELADLMMVASKEVESAICRLAQLARAAGLHLIIATQRPSVDVITGLIKANIPSRIAFAVSSATDSRTILDMGGADKLLGMGDMLFKSVSVDSDKPLRIQGAFVSDKEIERIVGFIKEHNPVVYDESLIEKITTTSSSSEKTSDSNDSDESDELIDEVIEFIVKKGSASGSMLQRRFKIGYNRAARIIEELEERGIVGPETGTSKPRSVLMDRYEYEDYMERRRDYI